ncbi:hypothetical protein NUITMVRE22_27860 [Enterococcus faecium]|nr:hypothetical protein A8C58_11310 [Enterococcus faecium]PQE80592.1 hypothetical protein CUS29_00130 [Enterococcus faecium]PQG97767.1 hypothetical protein CUS55_00205 [Enterococcus faecium]PQH06378.1 hypothetical protein CUS45_00715 [Enterococcus faecium]GER97927.1 hypothetical protein EfmAA708_29620 [Enterococcus faecium]
MLSHCTAQSPKGSFAKTVLQREPCGALIARLNRFETVLGENPYLVPKAPYRRSGQALTTLK